MRILSATYGGVDCLSAILPNFKDNKIIIRADNRIIGDVAPGVIKTLKVVFQLDDGRTETTYTNEGQLLVYPKTNHDRLGIFYSNNTNPKIQPAVQKSLETIEIAAKGKADILTCMWNHEPSNPFAEYIAWTKTSSHLNQLLQIMQLLYNAKEIGNYKYVSFLEHDVMYPEGYFDYPDIKLGEVITNMNYMGLCPRGWQGVPVKHEPFHQMTMRMDDAIHHCVKILPNALVTNSGLIEPQVPNIIRRKWECANPAVHINHGSHFTSHFSIYSSTDVVPHHSYWGNVNDYSYMFM